MSRSISIETVVRVSLCKVVSSIGGVKRDRKDRIQNLHYEVHSRCHTIEKRTERRNKNVENVYLCMPNT